MLSPPLKPRPELENVTLEAFLIGLCTDKPVVVLNSHEHFGWFAPEFESCSLIAWPTQVRTQLEWNSPRTTPTPEFPFTGGWIGWLEYELGVHWEPASRGSHAAPPAAARWMRCDDALVYSRPSNRWWSIGSPPVPDPGSLKSAGASNVRCGPIASKMGRDRYVAAAGRAIEYIRAGDVYQVNLAHELSGSFEGSARAAFAALTRAARPAMGAYFEWDNGDRRHAILSASPEMFLTLSPAGHVSTRPMKGTRPGRSLEADLRDAEKDRAELNMIIDLMRNDLGRVCRFGSVRVDAPRTIERHGPADLGVLQATGTVSGMLRSDISLDDLLRATFPGGSVTGAPKIRAMQIIRELEPSPRGVYCGAIGFVSDTGHAQFNIAIRTAVIEGRPGPRGVDDVLDGRLSYRVGAGIVADSDPVAEWDETLVKAGAIRSLCQVVE